MTDQDPTSELDPQFSTPDAEPRPWSEARSTLDEAEIYWLSTVRPDGRPHVTPVAAVWNDNALVFGTGPTERKAHNLASNAKVILTTGTNRLDDGFDIVVEGEAVRLTDAEVLRPISKAFIEKYADMFVYDIEDDGTASNRGGGEVLLFRVAPVKAFGFWRGDGGFSQTRWRFSRG
jgi:nitroimidazol reductase NimA-like FMN-containing flavoprotein (pyridoxamine 5'-phosphate oxidase superfamily)